MKTCAVIATHHKTGTVWMRTVFQRFSRLQGIRFVLLDRKSEPPRRRFRVPVVVMDDHAEFNNCKWILGRRNTRLFHLIRDPRDVVISAAHYHCGAKEAWLHWPRARFDGKTYQAAIREMQTNRTRFVFEMNNSAGKVITAMQGWDYGMPNSIERRYEQLLADNEGVMFGEILEHLGFEPHEIEAGREQFRQLSINGGDPVKPGHVRSGKAGQWEQVFDRDLAQFFLQKFGNVLVDLGYEKDAAWAAELPERRPGLDVPDAEPAVAEHAGSHPQPEAEAVPG